jgi:hypothetical protein
VARQRPRRGEPGPDVLISGDTGEYHPQGGAREGQDVFRESGDLQSREFGVPQADLPGGKGHTVNAATPHTRPAVKPERPADYHKYHGVPSDNEGYSPPEPGIGTMPRPWPEPKISDAVPVYIVEGVQARVIRSASPRHIICPASTAAEPALVCGQDQRRVRIGLLNESTNTDVRIGMAPGELVAGPGGALGGALVPWPCNSYLWFETQDSLYAQGATGSGTPLLSVIEVFEQRDG